MGGGGGGGGGISLYIYGDVNIQVSHVVNQGTLWPQIHTLHLMGLLLSASTFPQYLVWI